MTTKPDPKPNLIERVTPYSKPDWVQDTYAALRAAHGLIATMSGGDPDLRKAYEEAIK